MRIKRQAVASSSLASVGYNEEHEILEIEFNHGGVYQYFDVPKAEYEGLIARNLPNHSLCSAFHFFQNSSFNLYSFTPLSTIL